MITACLGSGAMLDFSDRRCTVDCAIQVPRSLWRRGGGAMCRAQTGSGSALLSDRRGLCRYRVLAVDIRDGSLGDDRDAKLGMMERPGDGAVKQFQRPQREREDAGDTEIKEPG